MIKWIFIVIILNHFPETILPFQIIKRKAVNRKTKIVEIPAAMVFVKAEPTGLLPRIRNHANLTLNLDERSAHLVTHGIRLLEHRKNYKYWGSFYTGGN